MGVLVDAGRARQISVEHMHATHIVSLRSAAAIKIVHPASQAVRPKMITGFVSDYCTSTIYFLVFMIKQFHWPASQG